MGARCHKGQGNTSQSDSALGPAPTHICFRAAICPDVAGGQQLVGPHLPSPMWAVFLSCCSCPAQTPSIPSTLTTVLPFGKGCGQNTSPLPIHTHSLASKTLSSLLLGDPDSNLSAPWFPASSLNILCFCQSSRFSSLTSVLLFVHSFYHLSSSEFQPVRILPTFRLGSELSSSMSAAPRPCRSTGDVTENLLSSVGPRVSAPGHPIGCIDGMAPTGWEGPSGPGGRGPMEVTPFNKLLLHLRHCAQAHLPTRTII